MQRLVDRSRMLSWMQCPRQRFLQYHFNGIGINTGQLRIPLETGSEIHVGLENLQRGETVDLAVDRTISAYRQSADDCLSAMATRPDHFDYVIEEQTALVEALVRVYAKIALPALRAEWDVIEVEGEYEWNMTPELRMMSRLDGLLRHKITGDLCTLSYKTDTGANIAEKLPAGRIDLQGLTEPLAVNRSGKYWSCPNCGHNKVEEPSVYVACAACTKSMEPLLCLQNKMEWLIKGSWKEDERGSGQKFQDSFLVRPWARPKPVGGLDFAWRYMTPCPGEAHQIAGANGRLWTCKGKLGTRHGLGDSWERTPIWRQMPIKEWIAILAEEPGALDSCLYLPPPIQRDLAHMEQAAAILAAQEEDISKRLLHVEQAADPIAALDVLFPASGGWTGQCLHNFGNICQFFTICHSAEPAAALLQWKENGFVARKPHHEGEMQCNQE